MREGLSWPPSFFVEQEGIKNNKGEKGEKPRKERCLDNRGKTVEPGEIGSKRLPTLVGVCGKMKLRLERRKEEGT